MPPIRHPDTSGQEWKTLFSQDLSDAIYPQGVWMWKNGELTATEDQVIWAEQDYDNFMLDLEFNLCLAIPMRSVMRSIRTIVHQRMRNREQFCSACVFGLSLNPLVMAGR